MDGHIQRRSLLGAGVSGVGTWRGQRFAQTALAQDHAPKPSHQGMTTLGEVDHLKNGFDPPTLLTQWDGALVLYNTVSSIVVTVGTGEILALDSEVKDRV